MKQMFNSPLNTDATRPSSRRYVMNKVLVITLIFLAAACSESESVQDRLSVEIWAELKKNQFEFVDFGSFAGDEWTRVCFFGPYNESSSQALGIDWHVGEHTDVLRSDGHNVIVFATDQEVIEYVVHSRGYGDFWKLSGKCFPRKSARFVRDRESGSWQNYTAGSA